MIDSGILKNQETDILEARMKSLHQTILEKRARINKHRQLVVQMETNCGELAREYERIDRVLFIRAGKINIIKNRITKMKDKKKDISALSDVEADELLKQLLDIRAKRAEETEGKK